MGRTKEDVKSFRDEQDAGRATAAGFAMIGLLTALLVFFITFAPAS